MAATAVTATSLTSTNPSAGVLLTMEAADAVNGNDVVSSGDEVIVIHNTGASPYTFSITSSNDPMGRLGTITDESIAAGVIKVVRLQKTGWADSAMKLNFSASHAEVFFGVARL